MSHRVITGLLACAAALGVASTAFNQVVRVPGAVYDFDRPNEKPQPAPKRDLSGIWEPAAGPSDAIQATGARAMPSDGRPEHQLPFTPAGREAWLKNKPAWGETMVPSALSNDPVPLCDPQGFPRIILHNFRTSQIVQTAGQVLVLYQFNHKWRNIWTDGRALPALDDNLEPRWWGYSTGRWEDDYTFVVDTTGLAPETWASRSGYPHSVDAHVQERFHRDSKNDLTLTLTMDDPKLYTRQLPLGEVHFRWIPNQLFDDFTCIPSEVQTYLKEMGDPAGDPTKPSGGGR